MTGRGAIHYGTLTGLTRMGQFIEPEQVGVDHFVTVAGVGDVDGDGHADIMLSSPFDNLIQEPGRAWLYLGGCRDVDSDGACKVDDCDDCDEARAPGLEERCGDGVDSDCDGQGGPDDDEDGDGLTWTEEQARGSSDCDAADTGEPVQETAPPRDSSGQPDSTAPAKTVPEPRCGCAGAPPTGTGGMALLLLAAVFRQTRSGRRITAPRR